MSRTARRLHLAIPVVLTAGLLSALPASQVSAATTPDLLTPAANATARVAAPPRAERSRLVRLDTATLAEQLRGDSVGFNLFADTDLTGIVEKRSRAAGVTSWAGRLTEATGTFTAVEVDGVYNVHVTTESGVFTITWAADGVYRVTEVSAPLADHEVADAATAGPAEATQPETAPIDAADAGNVIDVAFVYPAALVTEAGGLNQLVAHFQQGITQTNQTMTGSQIPVQLRYVGSRQVAATPGTDNQTTINQLRTPGDGIFDEAQALREETHADLVSLWLPGELPPGAGCGIGALGGKDPARDPDRAAWTVLYRTCATDNRTFTHEVGHNLSADHDPANAGTGAKPYGHGYVDLPVKRITVMAYYSTCQAAGVPDCVRIPHFSNPAVAYGGRVTGTDTANNARAITEQVAAVANYRQSQIYGATPTIIRPNYKSNAKVNLGAWAPANLTYSYQWYVDGAPVPGATGPAYRIPRRLIGHGLAVAVAGSAPFYAPTRVVSAPVVVGKALFKTTRPKIRGVFRVGHRLEAVIKGWKPAPTSNRVKKSKRVKISYAWFRNGKKIKGANDRFYRLTAKDRRKRISVKVTAKRKLYEPATRASKNRRIR